ncbi:hepatitis A virus cellular receptor 1 homolog [Dunckerocampus dactyliophorus]|uniref:hepatitis A virus cellular receptor 1 homolog n=1 Tax=Dunckerocampus dactyliophorus TaxID=161453 RepID=UPI002404C319|nr:hepatitis A virus cellular receptor 1 homolog [Dunckerocampus dactyliophorus]
MVSHLKLLLLICLRTVSKISSLSIVGQTGQNVTLPCKYNVKKNGLLSTCWGRGVIPFSGCNNLIISTSGLKVIGKSNRYKLLGPLKSGDVSLTILNATKLDGGLYGCRVEIPGFWNDDTHSITLTIKEAPQMTTTTVKTDVSTEKMAATITAVDMTSTESLQTSSLYNIKTKTKKGISVSMIVMGVLFGLILLATVIVITVIGRRRKRLLKIHQQQPPVAVSMRLSSTSSSLHFHNHTSAVENIYQMDEVEYDYLP